MQGVVNSTRKTGEPTQLEPWLARVLCRYRRECVTVKGEVNLVPEARNVPRFVLAQRGH